MRHARGGRPRSTCGATNSAPGSASSEPGSRPIRSCRGSLLAGNCTARLDLARFVDWFAGVVPSARDAEPSARLIAGGKSNLTCEVTDGVDQ